MPIIISKIFIALFSTSNGLTALDGDDDDDDDDSDYQYVARSKHSQKSHAHGTYTDQEIKVLCFSITISDSRYSVFLLD